MMKSLKSNNDHSMCPIALSLKMKIITKSDIIEFNDKQTMY
jgi:hypothetical protein